MLFRKDDIVSLLGTVKFDQGANEQLVHVDIIGDLTSRPIVEAAALTIVGPSFRVGDTVTWQDVGYHPVGTVLAIAGDRLWVRDNGDGDLSTIAVTNCRRADPDTAPPEMPPPSPLDI